MHFEGLPARICWLGYQERHLAGLKFNEMVASGELAGPIVIGRDHLDAGSVASPYRETEAMADGSDAIADWPLLNALLNTASGASWVSIHHGGGVGIGRSIHAGQVTVADGTDARRREARARAHERPRHRGHAARRRRLRPREGGRPRARPEGADAVTRRILITNIGELTTNVAVDGDPCGTIRDAAVLIEGERIAWVGPAGSAPFDRETAAGRRDSGLATAVSARGCSLAG